MYTTQVAYVHPHTPHTFPINYTDAQLARITLLITLMLHTYDSLSTMYCNLMMLFLLVIIHYSASSYASTSNNFKSQLKRNNTQKMQTVINIIYNSIIQ